MALYAIGKDNGVEKVRGNVNDKMKRKAKKSRTTIVKRKKNSYIFTEKTTGRKQTKI